MMGTALVVPHDASSAAVVRHWLVGQLAPVTGDPVVLADASLLVSELVGNAVRHARPLPGGGVEAEWEMQDDTIMLRVSDGGAVTTPQPRTVAADSPDGRGLAIVSTVAATWGVQRAAGRTSVWAALPQQTRAAGDPATSLLV
jgi:anti-sigma regulatory factor (Ser/Thr protein kinase)